MKKLLLPITILVVFFIPFALGTMQQEAAPRLEITGVNAAAMPTVTLTANIYDDLGQPVRGLTAADFALTGELASRAQIVSVENVTDDNLAFAVVLVIDTSSSMAGRPITLAKQAARTFIESIGPNDPVAIMTFNSTVQVVLDYTTNKQTLLNTIDGLPYGGQTALYQAGYDAVEVAANSPLPRRAVILLSDGAEYGGISRVGRSAAHDQAHIRGVPVYTIGLGYGIDRTYLQELSAGTNARNFESPDPDQLQQIFSDLAAQLRSQYVITLRADLPLDGKEYDLGLAVTTTQGSASANTILRAPIPVPLVAVSVPDTPISEPTDVTLNIKADDVIASVDFAVDGGAPTSLTAEPYTLSIDPVTLLPGLHTLDVTVTDAQGDRGALSTSFLIPALPSDVTVIPDLTGLGAINTLQDIILDVTGQTPVVSATYRIDGGEGTTITDVPFNYTIDPITLAPGEHTLTVEVLNQGGVTATVEQLFTVAALPPIISVSGLENGQSVDQPVSVTVDIIASQTPIIGATFAIDGIAVSGQVDAATNTALATIDPMNFTPGAQTLTVTVTDASGSTAVRTIDFMVTALPPVIMVDGLQLGETLTDDRTISLAFDTQTNITSVTYTVDGEDVERQFSEPFLFDINVLDFEPGAHVLSITAVNASGQSAATDLSFSIADAPYLTATALAPTATPTPTFTPSPTFTPTLTYTPTSTLTATPTYTPSPTVDVPATITVEAQLTQQREVTIVAATQASLDSTATEVAVQATGTFVAEASETFAAQMAENARGTATAEAEATNFMLATQDAQATINARAELNAQGTATRIAAATKTTEARATRGVEATFEAAVTATLNALATMTEVAQATNTETARGTEAALNATATEEEALALTNVARATATQAAHATATEEEALALTNVAQATATQEEALALTNVAQATATAELARALTEAARATATHDAQLALTATEVAALATATQDAALALTNIARATATHDAQLALTATEVAALATATQDAALALTNIARATATREAQLALTATEVAALATQTHEAELTATQQALQAATETAIQEATQAEIASETAQARALATAAAQQTQVAQAELNAQGTATRIARATLTVEARATQSADATATAEQATQNAEATEAALLTATVDTQSTANAQATADTRLAAIGSLTPTPGEETLEAQAAPSEELPPTLTPIGTLIPAEVPGQGAAGSDIIPIVIVIAVLAVVLVVVFLILSRGRRRRQ